MHLRHVAVAITAMASLSCGTLASPSTGDVDLPLSFVGPFVALSQSQTPHMTSSLVVSADSSMTLDEPSVVFTDRRVAFVTLTAGGHSVIGRAQEMTPLSVAFTGAMPILMPTLGWEGSSVRSPGAYRTHDGTIALAYAGDGGIGIATSSDGMTFTRMSDMPVLTAQSVPDHVSLPAEPSITENPSGGWLMTFRAGDSLWLARSMALGGPWHDVSRILSPPAVPADMADAGLAFDNVSLGDPAIAVLTTSANRTLYVVFFTAHGTASANSVVGAVASFDTATWSVVPHPVYSERLNAVRAGSFELVDSRTALLWIGTGPATSRVGSAALGPVVPRVQITQF